MAYMLLIMEPHGQRAERGLAGGQEAYARMQRFGEGLQARGLLRASESLASTEQAVRLQVRDLVLESAHGLPRRRDGSGRRRRVDHQPERVMSWLPPVCAVSTG